MKLQLRQQFHIESARFLPRLPDGHPCKNIHGHSFKITLTLVGECDSKVGWVMDYHEINTQAQRILNLVDHKLLNDVQGLENPTTENLCIWLYEKIKKEIPIIIQVTVSETHDTDCSYPVTTHLNP